MAGRTITGTPAREQAWQLSHVGNWSDLTTKNSGNTVRPTEERTHNTVNEITEIDPDADSPSTPIYDAAGNLHVFPRPDDDDEATRFIYDYRNRLIEVESITNYDAD